jgi:hypothetical protein
MLIISNFILLLSNAVTLRRDKSTLLNRVANFLNISYNSLEWLFTSPPKPHAFIILPLQSILGIILYNFLSNSKVILYKIVIMFTLVSLFKSWLSISFGIPHTTFDLIVTTYVSIVGGFLADLYILLPSPLALFNYFVHGKNIFSNIELPRSLKMNAPSDSNKLLPLFNFQDKNEGESSKSSVREKLYAKAYDLAYADVIKGEFSKFTEEMSKIVQSLKDRHEILEKNKDITKGSFTYREFILSEMLQDQLQFYNGSIQQRIELVKINFPSIPLKIKEELISIEKEIHEINNKLIIDITKIGDGNWRDDIKNIKIFFDNLNAHRNRTNKLIVKYENISHSAFKEHMSDIYKLKEFKQLVNVEGPKSIKEVVDQDSYLKKKISEIINANNKK